MYGAVDFTDSRHSGRATPAGGAKNACVWSRTPAQNASASATALPPIFAAAAETAGDAPDSLTRRRPSWKQVADSGSAWPPHSLAIRIAWSAEHSSATVASAFGSGTHLSETSVTMPSVPSAPVISRDTSKPATFFITWPPNVRSCPTPSSTRTPRIRSRAAPA